jgi:hypothetical protein
MFDVKFGDKAGIFVMLIIPPYKCGCGTDNTFIEGHATKASVYKSRSGRYLPECSPLPTGRL